MSEWGLSESEMSEKKVTGRVHGRSAGLSERMRGVCYCEVQLIQVLATSKMHPPVAHKEIIDLLQ